MDIQQAADGFGPDVIARRLGLRPWTVRRWWRGKARPSPATVQLVAILCRGELPPTAGASWAGWRFDHAGQLRAPDLARGFTPADLYLLHWLQQAASWREAAARRVRRAAGEAPAGR